MARKLVAAFLVAACVGLILLSLLVMANRSGARIVQERKELDHVAISVDDVPANWVAIDLNSSQVESLWSLLPDLLTVKSEATLHLSGFESADGIVGASTILIQTDSPAALPNDVTANDVLGPVARLLRRHNMLLVPQHLATVQAYT